MTNLPGNTDIYVGAFLILCSLLFILIPPKFGNTFYGVSTKWTIKSEILWAVGQKLFAVAFLVIGIIFLAIGLFTVKQNIPPFAMFALLIILWTISKYFIHYYLSHKYSNL